MSEQHSFAVFGLGRFGTSIVTHLAAHDVELLAVDRDHDRVNAIAEFVDQAVTGSADAEELLARIGVEHYDVVVFAMGEAFESSVMATMIAKERGAKRVVVKALNERQAQILRRVGADQVVLPEVEMGAKLARSLVNPNILDVIDQTNGISLTERRPDPEWVGQTLAEANIRATANLEVIALIRQRRTYIPAPADLALAADDVLVTIEQTQ
ncbi:potassium channel family protein [Lacticaseibacillus nasuensis]|uniref:Uncharacterized protein n=1 Tax=Lacticaseibacillus nasuensis JCM 17158 TaxID=1291734 RepID=A0A0R1JGW7_9LACO|nr:TrkA family potassium uptake protein [Lacticaseibacillus nasuensis]KRK70527.1 hypothetical protein FD02_GL000598 [Lacticaseibacillus nasuensis JCM 17158]MCX2456253.1 TrkA family potassium uptake protein [Lacticaseibacillus nasuensis]